ncbi:Serine/threonine-protein phosphatase 2A activator [Geodia barretti]|uniref:Serine/threonine-protein phosphatase 2A activator n=1 Tax=Geodia barretti TaxID=519541 RepID=A0AA35R9W3_GEOBA|nr:Serine/threonine-protein phosphatase 2A activator [Geodia barretti]
MAAEDRPVHEFRVPERLVKDTADLETWKKSQAYQDFTGFIYILNEAVKGKKNNDSIIDKLTGVLDMYMKFIDETPPLEQPERFGNKAYRLWSDRVRDSSEEVIKSLLPADLHGAVEELQPYLLQGFGNAIRIDYGTGHEMKFAAFLCCLMKMKVIPQDCAAALVLHVIRSHVCVLQPTQPSVESQTELTPLSFVEETLVNQNASDYMFMSCVAYINKVKTGPFAEHSNSLWGISSVAEWTKVNSGLIKMYKAEVLGKFPVIQHFPFGTILSFEGQI